MKTMSQLALAMTIIAMVGTSANAVQLAYYGDGTDEDLDAELNLAAAVANVTVSDLDSFGVLAGTLDTGNDLGGDTSRITRPSFSTPTPAGPTAGSASGSEWFEARSRENQGSPTSTNNYFFFTVTADSGFSLDLDTLKYDFWLSDAVGSGATADAEAFVSVDGGAFTSFGSVTASDTDGDINLAAPVATANIDLSSITGAQMVEVRVGIGYSQGNSNGISGFAQGFQLDGTVGTGCSPGDTDNDGDIDTVDLTTAISNFTGAGGSGQTCADGDTDDDGDIDTVDLTFSISNFTGALAGDPNVPDLIYDPATGNVTIDTEGQDVISFSLQGGPFNTGNTDFSGLPAGLNDNIAAQIGWTSFNIGAGLVGVADLGAILPAGLDEAGLLAALAGGANYGLSVVTGGGGAFDIIIPEPASLMLMGIGAMALVRRRRAA